MEYKLFTLPNCPKCKDIKEFLREKGIEFKEVDLGEDEGVSELRKSYVQIKDKIKRTEDGQMPIPLFISYEGDTVKEVSNLLEEIKKIVS